jgi:hypothetical protein
MCGAFFPCILYSFIFVVTLPLKAYTIEFHILRLIGLKRHPDIQKIRIIEFFFENRLRWKFEVEKCLRTAVLGYTFIYVYIKS